MKVVDENDVEIEVVSNSKDPELHTVYNFEVDDFHTYFVGENRVWVHNDENCIALYGVSTMSDDAVVKSKSQMARYVQRVGGDHAEDQNKLMPDFEIGSFHGLPDSLSEDISMGEAEVITPNEFARQPSGSTDVYSVFGNGFEAYMKLPEALKEMFDDVEVKQSGRSLTEMIKADHSYDFSDTPTIYNDKQKLEEAIGKINSLLELKRSGKLDVEGINYKTHVVKYNSFAGWHLVGEFYREGEGELDSAEGLPDEISRRISRKYVSFSSETTFDERLAATIHAVGSEADISQYLDIYAKLERGDSFVGVTTAVFTSDAVTTEKFNKENAVGFVINSMRGNNYRGDSVFTHDYAGAFLGKVLGYTIGSVVENVEKAYLLDSASEFMKDDAEFNLIVDGLLTAAGGVGKGLKVLGKIVNAAKTSKRLSFIGKFSDKVKDSKVFSKYFKRASNTNILSKAQRLKIQQALQNRVDEIRSVLPKKLKGSGNVGVAEVDIPGLPSEFKAHSRINYATDKGSDGFVLLREQSEWTFQPKKVAPDNVTVNTPDSYLRQWDTEFKILDDIAYRLGDNPGATGTINLFTE